MGLLDALFGSGGEDPRSQAMSLLAAGLGRGDVAGGLLAANQTFAAAPAMRAKREMEQMQLEAHRMKLDQERRQQSFLDNLPSPTMQNSMTALSAGGGPTNANAARIQPVSPLASLLHEGARSGAVPLGEYLKTMQPKELPFNKVDPKDYTPESIAAFAQSGGDYTRLVPVRKREVGPGGQVYDPFAVQPGAVLADPNKPFSIGANGAPAPNLPYQNYEFGKARAGATNVSVNTGQKGLDNELKIRSDFRSEPIYKAHQEVLSAHSQISAALKQASPAGDLAGATKIMKILDPGSVVRESELGMAMAATGALDKLQNYAASIANGTKLTPKQRADFQQLADKLYSESGKQYNAKRNEYAGFADDYGLNSNRIVGPAVTSPKLPTPAAPGGAPSIDFLLQKYGR